MIVTNRVALQDELFWQRVPDGLNAIVTKIGASPSTVTEVGAEFVEDYREYFDHWPESHAFAAYDALRLAADAMERAQTIDSDDIIDSLEMADIELASGRYYFPYGHHNPPDGEEVPDYMWHQWPDVPLLFLQYTAIDQPVAEMDVLWPPAYGTINEPVNR